MHPPFWLNQDNKKVDDAFIFLGDAGNYTIFDLNSRGIVLLTFKALKEIAPHYCSKIAMAKKYHVYSTRRAAKNHLHLPLVKTKFSMRTFSYRAPKIWNGLPFDILDTKRLLKFKFSVK